jgi:lambda family phage portal protein
MLSTSAEPKVVDLTMIASKTKFPSQIISANPNHPSNNPKRNFGSANWFDRFVSFFSPTAGIKRVHARQLLRSYEGASKGRRLKNWVPSNASASVEVAQGGALLRARSRDLSRNTAYGTKALEVIVNNTIGTGILLKAPTTELQKKWDEWFDSSLIDYEGNLNGYEFQSLMLRSIVEGGEVLIRKYRNNGKDKKISPFKLQLLEPDMIDSSYYDKDGLVQDGVQLDEKGRVVGYHLFEQHPGSYLLGNSIRSSYKSNFISKSEIFHVFKRLRIGQIRGVPWPTPVILKMRDFDDYDDAQLMRQKIAACFVGFLKTNEDPITQSTATEERKPMSERMEPGIFEELPPGMDITLSAPPSVGGDYEPYVRRVLGAIAAGYGISYEALTGDLSKTNYSSGRMGWIEMQRNIQSWQWQMIVPQGMQMFWNLFLEGESIATGEDLLSKYRNQAIYTPPRREMIDPTKEVPAMKDAVRSGFMSLSEALRQQGFDPETVLRELANDLKLLDSLELKLDSDPRNGLNSSTAPSEEISKEDPEEDELEEDQIEDGDEENQNS